MGSNCSACCRREGDQKYEFKVEEVSYLGLIHGRNSKNSLINYTQNLEVWYVSLNSALELF